MHDGCFSKCILHFEDGNMIGYLAAVAWNYDEGSDSNADADKQSSTREMFETASLTIPGVIGWLTGMQHKPIVGQMPTITVIFYHDCLQWNPKHSVCYPVISVCGRTITFPVTRMEPAQKLKEMFIMAYCKGQSFAKPYRNRLKK